MDLFEKFVGHWPFWRSSLKEKQLYVKPSMALLAFWRAASQGLAAASKLLGRQQGFEGFAPPPCHPHFGRASNAGKQHRKPSIRVFVLNMALPPAAPARKPVHAPKNKPELFPKNISLDLAQLFKTAYDALLLALSLCPPFLAFTH